MLERQNAEVRIIDLLKRASGAVSGALLSRELGMSRAAVWKHIEVLRKAGYAIEAKPRAGYRLVSTEEAPYGPIEFLNSTVTDFIGARIAYFDTVESTNTEALELARAGAEEGTVVVADTQLQGRGRIGRTWVSPAAVNLYTSVILRPAISPPNAHMLTLLAAVALAEVIEEATGKSVAVKWPNDILVEGRKIAGILLEMDSEIDRVHFVVIGIGVNINMDCALLPAELRTGATSVAVERGGNYSRVEFAANLYYALEKWYKIVSGSGAGLEGFAPVVEAWKGYFPYEGKRLRVVSFSDSTEGICVGIDFDGALLLQTAPGTVERIISGDVQLCREAPEDGVYK
ncbi:MAG: biotin--[acetyl-CoA-carboxylase] ligase [Proteobacteria bacterium]|nr:biotin--[acetyl-CoA-carboxylase] ligase [Pseudomonadota bacterium]